MTNPLGRIKLHDPKSKQYPFAVNPAGRSVRHTMKAPNVDQFYTSGCVGFSGTNMLNCAVAVRSRQRFNAVFHSRRTARYLGNDDGIENYSGATKNDPFPGSYPPVDEGSSAIGLMKHWRKNGIIMDYRWAFTFNQFLAAVEQQPVLVGTEWFDDMSNPDELGRIKPSGESKGGHEYLVDQVIYPTGMLGFENSWGENWGVGGRFYMSFGDFQRLLENGGDCAIPRFL